MKKRLSAGTCIVIALLVCIATFLVTASAFQTRYNAGLTELNEKAAFYDKLKDVYDKVQSDFIKETGSTEMDDAYLSAYIDSLGDRYSAYLSKDEMDAYLSDSSGEMVGIGVHVAYDNESEGIYISSVIKDSPALSAGIQAGDIIVQTGDIKITKDTYNSALNAIKGKAGESVSLVVRRGEELLNFTVVRAIIVSETVLYEKLDNSIAYITILGFESKTADAFKNVLEQASADGCTKYIFDMRNNHGGNLDEIVSILDMLLPEGPIVNIVDKNGNITTKNSAASCLEAPMVVLVNGETASAAELFTAALRDYKLAAVVGTTTFGKGTMQIINTLPDGSGLKISTAYYNPPYGENYDGVGITPDVVIEMPEDLAAKFYTLTNEEDNQLQKAIEVITNENN